MKKKILLMFLVSFFLISITSGKASARDSKVRIMFMDTLNGAAIGAVIGGIVILNDNDNWGKKLTLGVTLGAIGGLAFGIVDGFDVLARKNNEPIAVPTRPLLAFRKTSDGKTETIFHMDIMSVYF